MPRGRYIDLVKTFGITLCFNALCFNALPPNHVYSVSVVCQIDFQVIFFSKLGWQQSDEKTDKK